VATGRDFDPDTGKLKPEGKGLVRARREGAREVAEELHGKPATVADVEQKPYTERPYPPFTTSTLQQEAARKLRYAAQRTMRAAQRLYENGFITYMRTDSTTLSSQAIDAARTLIGKRVRPQYLPDAPRQYQTKVKNAQEAHEAIRPAGTEFVHPSALPADMGDDERAVYELIWRRTVACQMKDAQGPAHDDDAARADEGARHGEASPPPARRSSSRAIASPTSRTSKKPRRARRSRTRAAEPAEGPDARRPAS
jgi:DNA topoisomerase-1